MVCLCFYGVFVFLWCVCVFMVCLCFYGVFVFLFTSRALSKLVVLVIFMLYKWLLVKPYVPSDKLEDSSVVDSVIDMLFVLMVCLCFNGVFVF